MGSPSLDFNVRPDKVVRDVSQADLLVPDGERGVRQLGICLACGVMFSLLFVWTPLAMASLLGFVSAAWVYAIVLAVALLGGIGLFGLATWDFRRWREWAEGE